MITLNKLRSIELVAFDFDGVFTDNMVYLNEDGQESVRCWRSDGIGLKMLKEVGIKTYIISTEKNSVVKKRARKLQIPCINNVSNKADAILNICSDIGISPDKTMFVGNDINDIPAFQSVGMPIGVSDSHSAIDPFVMHKLNRSGGFGAVREICDLLYEAKISK
jgi:YrbI family 3-deoxy-D-manno-octulosonate 8-phosphate phosphatase